MRWPAALPGCSLEARGNAGPRGMSASAEEATNRRDRTRLTGRLRPLFLGKGAAARAGTACRASTGANASSSGAAVNGPAREREFPSEARRRQSSTETESLDTGEPPARTASWVQKGRARDCLRFARSTRRRPQGGPNRDQHAGLRTSRTLPILLARLRDRSGSVSSLGTVSALDVRANRGPVASRRFATQRAPCAVLDLDRPSAFSIRIRLAVHAGDELGDDRRSLVERQTQCLFQDLASRFAHALRVSL